MDIPENILNDWQDIVDLMAELINIPAGLIMKINSSEIEVCVSSKTKGNPYHPGETEILDGSGLYCEKVIKTKQKLNIPNALKDKKWKNNPDIKYNMISYLGFPILYPNGTTFGTICVLDKKENSYSKKFEKLIMKFRDLIQSNLYGLIINNELQEKNKILSEFISELKILRGIIPICSSCRKIKNEVGNWKLVEEYLKDNADVSFTHVICPECYTSQVNKIKKNKKENL